MPGPRPDIDREGIAASIAIHGYRGTATRTGVSLGTVQRIGKAAGVSAPDPLMRPAKRITEVAAPVTIPSPSGTAVRVDTPAHAVITDAMQDAGRRNALAVALRGTVVLEAAHERALADPEKALAESPLVASEVKAQQGANVPYFERQSDNRAGAVVNILTQSIERIETTGY